MKNPLKIAVYSGEIPSTTFIERLILGLSNKEEYQILLFGLKHKSSVNYNKNVCVYAYTSNKLSKGLHLLKYTILLELFKRSEKKRLNAILASTEQDSLNNRVKYYPVLWHKPDIFHIQWAKSLKDWSWVQDFGIKLVLSLRGAHINYSPIADHQLSQVYRENFPKVDGFHAVSKAMKKEASQYGAPLNKCRVIYSGMESSVLKEEEKKRNSVLQIISVGRSHWIKGYSYALDACKILRDQEVAFKYYIVGGLNNLELMYQIDDLGLKSHVELLDNMPFEKVQKLIHQSDLLILPSLEEGIANVVLEAMLLETMVLSTHCGGMDEILKEGENGFLVPIRDVRALADAIIKIIKLSPSDYKQIIGRAKKSVCAQHNVNHMISGMSKLYEDTINDNFSDSSNV